MCADVAAPFPAFFWPVRRAAGATTPTSPLCQSLSTTRSSSPSSREELTLQHVNNNMSSRNSFWSTSGALGPRPARSHRNRRGCSRHAITLLAAMLRRRVACPMATAALLTRFAPNTGRTQLGSTGRCLPTLSCSLAFLLSTPPLALLTAKHPSHAFAGRPTHFSDWGRWQL